MDKVNWGRSKGWMTVVGRLFEFAVDAGGAWRVGGGEVTASAAAVAAAPAAAAAAAVAAAAPAAAAAAAPSVAAAASVAAAGVEVSDNATGRRWGTPQGSRGGLSSCGCCAKVQLLLLPGGSAGSPLGWEPRSPWGLLLLRWLLLEQVLLLLQKMLLEKIEERHGGSKEAEVGREISRVGLDVSRGGTWGDGTSAGRCANVAPRLPGIIESLEARARGMVGLTAGFSCPGTVAMDIGAGRESARAGPTVPRGTALTGGAVLIPGGATTAACATASLTAASLAPTSPFAGALALLAGL
ncbi:unnamed protein product, partial [Closterium sp. NIES-54]